MHFDLEIIKRNRNLKGLESKSWFGKEKNNIFLRKGLMFDFDLRKIDFFSHH